MPLSFEDICKRLQIPLSVYTDWPSYDKFRSDEEILMDIYDALPAGFTSQYTIMRSGQEPWHVFYMPAENYWEVVGTFQEVVVALANRYFESLEE